MSIENVLNNLSEYSTPPRVNARFQEANFAIYNRDTAGSGFVCGLQVDENCAQSANSGNRSRQNSFSRKLESRHGVDEKQMDEPSFSLGVTHEEQTCRNANTEPTEVICQGTPEAMNVDDSLEGDLRNVNSKSRRREDTAEKGIPSVSLGLTQEEQLLGDVLLMPEEQTQRENAFAVTVADNIVECQGTRKSKRQRVVPPNLLADYQCGSQIMLRAREWQKYVFGNDSVSEMERKYERLLTKLSHQVVMNVGGLFVSGKDIALILSRSRVFPAKVIDILVRLVRTSCMHNMECTSGRCVEFLDSKFIAAMNRTFPKFCKSSNKETFVFPPALRAMFPTSAEADTLPTRFACQPAGEDPIIQYFDVVRPKSLEQVTNPAESGLMAVVLMARHAFYGKQACKHISSSVLEEEGKRAAILTFEMQEKL
ncbi:uncharacterized protein LOC108854790 isoform X2 [Raphanus sativus]|uniref:Uncharacterized protein LOC108854790 isoform X2 n=1 Tax=Raphanus sativus TaxID=3726 RepID=A0A9W3DKH6_RAPSA|nr:uncharacterized protein LOC108854790 isoform X2 [Raphanus sativus]